MELLEKDIKEKLLDPKATPCLSLYQPTHRSHPDNAGDPIRYKNLVRELEQSLAERFEQKEIGKLIEPFKALEEDREFWNHTLDGLAVLGCEGFFQAYKLQRPVPELAVAADSFHTKPLMRIVQSSDRFHVLGLDRAKICLFEGNRDAIAELELPASMPRTVEEALGEELTNPHSTVASYGGTEGSAAMHHGHGGKSPEVDKDTERFFRAVDKAVYEQYSEPSGLPLILAALPEHHGVFETITGNNQLLGNKIAKHPDSLDKDELRRLAWEAFKPTYAARLEKFVEEFGNAKANERGSSDPAEIGRAIAEGRAAVILFDADKRIAGKYDPERGLVSEGELSDPETGDLLDDLGEAALRQGAEIIVVPSGDMPTDTGAAAIFRY